VPRATNFVMVTTGAAGTSTPTEDEQFKVVALVGEQDPLVGGVMVATLVSVVAAVPLFAAATSVKVKYKVVLAGTEIEVEAMPCELMVSASPVGQDPLVAVEVHLTVSPDGTVKPRTIGSDRLTVVGVEVELATLISKLALPPVEVVKLRVLVE
jgi:hypothetical protein